MNSCFQQLSDEQWSLILSLRDLHLPPERGVPRSDLRKVWNSLLFVLTRGCCWVDLPRDFDIFVSRSTAHGWLKTWSATDVFDNERSFTDGSSKRQNRISFNWPLMGLARKGSRSPSRT